MDVRRALNLGSRGVQIESAGFIVEGQIDSRQYTNESCPEL